jgi:hypothetical protein
MSRFGDTPKFGQPSLCATCRAGQNVTGPRFRDSATFCRLNGMEAISMPQPVYTCSDYDDRRQPSLWQLEKIAWRFSVDEKRKTAGFYNPVQHALRVAQGIEPADE